ncbi:MAG: hypothetical protein WC586_01875 [Methanoregula sp.]
MRIQYSVIKNKLNYLIAFLGVFLGLITAFFLYVRSPEYSLLGVIVVIFCIIYIIMAKFNKVAVLAEFIPTDTHKISKLLNIIFLISFVLILYILIITLYIRPIEFFFLIAIISGVIGIEILTLQNERKYNIYLILVKIITLSILLRWSLYYIFPGSYLGVDPWFTGVLYTDIAENGFLNMAMGGYYFNPLHHVLVVNIIHLTGLNSCNALIFSIALIEAVSVIFIYFTGNLLFNQKVGLLAALVLAVNNLHIWWGWWPVAQTFGIVFFSIILWEIVKIHKENNLKDKVILTLFFIAIIFTHTVSSFVAFIVVGFYVVGNYIYKIFFEVKEKVNKNLLFILAVFALIILAHWIYYAGTFTYFTYMGFGKTLVSGSAASTIELTQKIVPVLELNNKLCSMLFYGFSIAGLLALLSAKFIDKYRFSYTFAGISLLGMIFLNTFLPIPVEILIGRWFVFVQILLAVLAALGIFLLVNFFSGNKSKIITVFVLLFAISFLMTTNTIASFDSPLYPDYLKDRAGLKESEMRATDTISLFADGNIKIDELGSRSLNDNYAHMEQFKNPVKLFNYNDIIGGFTTDSSLVIIRNAVFRDPMTIFYPDGSNRRIILKNVFSGNSKNKYQKIYDTNSAFVVFT